MSEHIKKKFEKLFMQVDNISKALKLDRVIGKFPGIRQIKVCDHCRDLMCQPVFDFHDKEFLYNWCMHCDRKYLPEIKEDE